LIRWGITADGLTLLGVALAFIAGLLAAASQPGWAAIVLILSGPLDALDGTVARLSGVTGKFGAFLDSTCDRYSEGCVLVGVAIYGFNVHDQWLVVLAVVALWGSLLVSYTRSRAETLGVDCKVGVLTRLERVVITIVMLLANPLRPDLPIGIGLIALAMGSHITTLQRVLHVRRALQ
jgi:CDP-diacylglycerol--glycerol-3-phosphate 3-phosphatidyltransferase